MTRVPRYIKDPFSNISQTKGYHMNLDFRTMDPKPFMEIFPAIIPLNLLDHKVILSTGSQFEIPQAPLTKEYEVIRHSYETASPISLSEFGSTTVAPLGKIAHARSGDKADNFNVGLWVRHEDEYPWLQSFLTVERLKELLGEDWKTNQYGEESRVERCEFPNLLAVHFRVLDFLGGGIASSNRIDGLGKGIGEYLRSKFIPIPVKFLERAHI